MPELRFDPLRREPVVIAPERAARPQHFRIAAAPGASPAHGAPDAPAAPDAPDALPAGVEACPFCPGNESETPAAIFVSRRRGHDGPDDGRDGTWDLRVVPNRFPAFRRDATAHGAHEVVIETEQHALHPADYAPGKMRDVIACFRDRAAALLGEGFGYVLVFRNEGPLSGASLPHPHAQIVALPEPPDAARRMIESLAEHRARTGRCLLCDDAAAERAAGVRVVRDAGGFVTHVPYAARFAHEMRIVAAAHPEPFHRLGDAALDAFAAAVQDALARLRRVAGATSFNGLTHVGPGFEHWHFELIPRATRIAGFELASGIHINAVAPEDSARRLRC